MMKHNVWYVIGLSALLSACVTINIYFPAAAAEKAADKIIEEVWQLKNGEKPADAKPTVAKPAETKPAEAK
jgi:hypothetical protein